MLKEIVMAGTVLTLCTASLVAHPGNRSAHRRMERHRSVEQIAERLQLSPGQVGALRELRESQRAKQQDLRERMKSAAVEFRNLRDAGDPRAENALERMRELRDERLARKLAGRADFERILTPEQRETIKQRRREKE